MRLELNLRPEIVETYKSASQRARILTETWARENLYCVACTSDSLSSARSGEKVVDFICPDWGEIYQLKSQSHPFGSRVANSAYEPKIKAIRSGSVPNFIFLRYDRIMLRVLDLFLVPRHFITESVVEKRKPLSDNARRRGWVGSNIILSNLPQDARIKIVQNGRENSPKIVRGMWNRFLFLRKQSTHSRGWLADVLACIRELGSGEFTLADVYSFEKRLSALHPKNRNIRPKIRQQLQILRAHGIKVSR